MNELVAIVLPGGPAFVDELRGAWDRGDAVLPVDTRLPVAAIGALLDDLAPSVVVDAPRERSRRAGVPVEPGDALVMATSGTTGRPKGVVLTHAAIEASSRATTARLGIDPARHKWLGCLPVSHIGGLAVITRSLHSGTPFEVLAAFDADAVRAAAGRGATHTSLVPTALARIDPSVFECILIGGASPPAIVPPNGIVTYAMTETASGVWYGDRALDGVEIAIRAGEIHVRAPMLLRCYRDGHDPKTPDGWLPTGDAGEIDSDGQLVVHGRRGDMIITGGENVWPAAVERALAAHPSVAEVMVEGRSDAEWGARVAAIVVPRDAGAPPTLDELRAFARESLPAYALPRQLVLAPALPRTPLGKLRRNRKH
ncbi:MAG TPA: AMP-binding protein [Acidimicrobiales bacterium]|nr:AMP-binding protein [Acidimicrobiales bacterium]